LAESIEAGAVLGIEPGLTLIFLRRVVRSGGDNNHLFGNS
jgi:hypothetical protein